MKRFVRRSLVIWLHAAQHENLSLNWNFFFDFCFKLNLQQKIWNHSKSYDIRAWRLEGNKSPSDVALTSIWLRNRRIDLTISPINWIAVQGEYFWWRIDWWLSSVMKICRVQVLVLRESFVSQGTMFEVDVRKVELEAWWSKLEWREGWRKLEITRSFKTITSEFLL